MNKLISKKTDHGVKKRTKEHMHTSN